jgi:uncharacterized protein with ParB-like and HNH nuclease domain
LDVRRAGAIASAAMEALVRSVHELFSGQHRFVVPPYQRPYVWTEELQWEPFWEDVERITDSPWPAKTSATFWARS